MMEGVIWDEISESRRQKFEKKYVPLQNSFTL